jgi:hypothetical protein
MTRGSIVAILLKLGVVERQRICAEYYGLERWFAREIFLTGTPLTPAHPAGAMAAVFIACVGGAQRYLHPEGTTGITVSAQRTLRHNTSTNRRSWKEDVMLKVHMGKELVIKVRNEIGVLAHLTRLLADKGINVEAASAWVDGANGMVHLVTDDNLRAAEALQARSYNPRVSDVVLAHLAHKPGMLRHVTELLAAEGIDIHHLYASTVSGQPDCMVVMATANNDRAIVALNG